MLPKLNLGPDVLKSLHNLSDTDILEGSQKNINQNVKTVESIAPSITETDSNILKSGPSTLTKNPSKSLRK